MAESKLIKELRGAAEEVSRDSIYMRAVAEIERKDNRITSLARENRNLRSQMDRNDSGAVVDVGEYDRKDLVAAIAGSDKAHLQIVLDSIFGAA